MMSVARLFPLTERIVLQQLAVRPGERVCVVTDLDRSMAITEALITACRAADAETVALIMPPAKMGNVELPRVIAAALQAADVIINQTSFHLGHTEALRAAIRRGARSLSMRNFTEEMAFVGPATADYAHVKAMTLRLAEILRTGREGRVTTPTGTNLTFLLEGRQVFPFFGEATEAGSMCAFPDGEVALSPVEGSASGVLIDPLCIEVTDIGYLREHFRAEVENGRVLRVSGGKEAELFAQILSRSDNTATNLAEVAIGTNPMGRPYSSVREAKKASGVVHIALGDSKSLGGTVQSSFHVDSMFRCPTYTVDGRILVQDGVIVEKPAEINLEGK